MFVYGVGPGGIAVNAEFLQLGELGSLGEAEEGGL